MNYHEERTSVIIIMKLQEIKPIILASQSPRRKEILENHGIAILIRPANADETLPEVIDPEDAVSLLSRKKALACYHQVCPAEFSEGLIIAADTIVYKDEILGKPIDERDAFRMLSLYRGTSHQVLTGVTLLNIATGYTHTFVETTSIWCKKYSDDDILEYIHTCKPYDKAGAYGIQEDFSNYIDHYDGDYENVVGLPYERLARETEYFTAKEGVPH